MAKQNDTKATDTKATETEAAKVQTDQLNIKFSKAEGDSLVAEARKLGITVQAHVRRKLGMPDSVAGSERKPSRWNV